MLFQTISTTMQLPAIHQHALVLKDTLESRSELTHEETQEFYQIVESNHDYETEMFNYPVAQSVPEPYPLSSG